jgi:hypothetical protein
LKSHIRDYCTEAFRFYARNGKSADAYEKKIYAEALVEYIKRQGNSGISCPTEAAIIRAEQEVTNKIAEISDMNAVEMTLAELSVSPRGKAIIDAISIVYFKDADKDLEKGDIHTRVQNAAIKLPAGERTVYRWLGTASKLFAEKRGLRY